MRRTLPSFEIAAMPAPKLESDLLDPVDAVSDEDLPPRFTEAHEQICDLIERLKKAGIPTDTVLAALMAELMPRLVQIYGPDGVVMMLKRLAGEISSPGEQPTSIQ